MKLFYCSMAKLYPTLAHLLLPYLLMWCWQPALAQAQFQLRGRVVDQDKSPLTGANVQLKGVASGSTTDANGHFALMVDKSSAEIVVSFIGYRSVDTVLALPLKSELVLTLHQDLNLLNEVTVSTGYWQISKRLSTGNISKISSQTIAMQPVPNLLQTLQGRVAGLFIQQETGVPGGGMRIRIRGTNSIAAGNEPFYIIDGIPFGGSSLLSGQMNSIMSGGNPLSSFNTSDIESIEILKDADATAIYGSRGANGVIIVTTKQGKAGRTRLNLNVETGISRVSNQMKLLNTSQYVAMRKQAYQNDESKPTGGFDGYDLLEYDTTRYTDWQKKLIGGAASRINAQGSISGGSKNTTFVFGGGYYKEGSVFPGSFSYQRANGHFNLSHQSQDARFKVGVSLNYQIEKNDAFSGDITGNAIQLMPNAPDVYDPNGKLNWGPFYFDNPYSYLLRSYKLKKNNMISHLNTSYRILDDLHLRVSAGYTAMQTDEHTTTPIASFHPLSGVKVGSAGFGNGSSGSWIIEPQLEYEKKFSSRQFNLLVGATMQQNVFEKKTISAVGYTSDAQLDNIRAAASFNISEYGVNQYKYGSVFGRINYVEKEKYLLNLTARRDGSSRFGPDNRFANFWAVGAGWIFSNERIIKSLLPLISFGKLRGSYGTTGNDQIADYGYLDSYVAGSYPYDGAAVFVPSRLANPQYSWEINKKLEAGLELGFIGNRISLEISYYLNRSSNQLVGYPLPATTGFTSIQFNLPAKVQNSGVEFELSASIMERARFSWSSSLNLTLPETKLLAYPNLDGSSYAGRYVIGKSLSLARVYGFDGVDSQTGIYKFKDLDGDAALTAAADQKLYLNLAPKSYGGISNTFKSAGWQLDVFFQFAVQDGYNEKSSFNMPGTPYNQPVQVLDRWKAPGDLTEIQKYSQNFGSAAYSAYSNSQYSSASVSDASYLRLKNVSLAYSFPANWTKGVGIAESRVSLSGQNLFTFTRYLGLDPETQSFINLPTLRTMTLGLNLTL